MAFVYMPILSLLELTGVSSCRSHDPETATPPGYHTVSV
jgi:hypothetical protein